MVAKSCLPQVLRGLGFRVLGLKYEGLNGYKGFGRGRIRGPNHWSRVLGGVPFLSGHIL